MDDKMNIKKPEIDLLAVYNYFDEHPIMGMGVAISILAMSICKILDDKFNE